MEDNEEASLLGHDLDSWTRPWEHDNGWIRLPAQLVKFLWPIAVQLSAQLVEFLSPIFIRLRSALKDLAEFFWNVFSEYICTFNTLYTLVFLVILCPCLIYIIMSRGEFPLGFLILFVLASAVILREIWKPSLPDEERLVSFVRR